MTNRRSMRAFASCFVIVIVPLAVPAARAQTQAGLRDAIEAAQRDGIDAAEFQALAPRVVSLHDLTGNRGDAIATLRLASTLCWHGPPEQSHELRAWALSKAAEHAPDSDRARQMLLSAFHPPLHRVELGRQPAELERFERSARQIAMSLQDPRIRADLALLPLAVRIEVFRTWDAPWFDEAARQRAMHELQKFRDENGNVPAADGRPYSDVAGEWIAELKDAAFGAPLPALALQDIAGRPISLEEHAGKIVLLVCWSSWCLPCMKAVPDEKAMAARLADEPFVFIGINGDASRDAAQQASAAHQMPWRSVWAGPGSGGASLVAHLRVRGWPSAFVLDGEGRIRAKFVGSIYRPTYSTDDVERAVREALSECR